MASAADCIAEIEKAAGGRIDDDQIEDLVSELEWARREFGDGKEYFDFTSDLVKDAQLTAAIEARNAQINVLARARLRQAAAAADELYGDPSLAIEAAMVGVNRSLEGGRDSVDARSNAYMRQYTGELVAGLRDAGLTKVYASGALEREIARELWDLSLKTPTRTATDSAQAKTIAGIIHKIKHAGVERENRAGAWIKHRQGHVVRQNHDRARIERAGFDAWANEVRGKLNWFAMKVQPDKQEETLREVYDFLVTGARKELGGAGENDLQLKFNGPANIAKKDSQHRVLIFKAADGWFDYNEKFGVGNLRESINADFSRMSRNTALMEKMGTNPGAMFETVIADLALEYKRAPQKVRRLRRGHLRRQLAEIDGSVNHAQNHSMASIGRGIRAWQTLAKLGGAVISSLADLANVAIERRYQGRNLLEMWGDSLAAPMQGLTAGADRRHAAELIGVGIDGAIGDFVSRFAAQDDVPGRISKLQAAFFKLNLLGPWTDGVKRGAGLMLARDLAMRSNMRLEELPEATQRMLRQYGLDARDWEIARGAILEAEDGRAYMMPGEVANVRGQVFTGLSRRRQDVLRDEVALKLRALITDSVEFASPTPGARERAILRLGLQPGTEMGELIRFFMQFKAFPITVLSRPLGRAIYGGGTKRGMAGAIARGEADILGLATYIAFGTMLGYISLQAKEMAKGRSPREADINLFYASMLQGGGLGIYGDFLFGETNRFGNSLTASLAGPVLGGVVDDASSIYAAAMRGEDVAAKTVRLLQSNLPFANLFYTKAGLDYLVWYQMQEMASPGYLRRTEARIRRENNQTMMFPPSRAIPHGGGDRIFEGVR